jgi:hypothetical protein
VVFYTIAVRFTSAVGGKEMQPPVELSPALQVCPGSWRRSYLQDFTSHKARDSVLTAYALRNLEHMDESRLSESATMKDLACQGNPAKLGNQL